MGNALRYLCGDCLSPQTSEGAHEVIPGSTGFDLLARDLFQFENTAQVPEGLSQHVDALKKTQATWYKKILAAWKEDPPSNAEQAAILIVRTLQKQQKVHVQVDARAVLDGDSINVYVDTKSPRESAVVPISVQEATIERHEARARKDYARADPLKEQIESAGYRVFDANRNGDDVLARKYRIRLRGVDAPEGKQPYGKEAREALLNLVEGKCLRILVYGEDRYGRTVGDVYTRDVFVQEVLLKQGWVWHYTHYDKRPEFAEWQKQARAARVGIWASSNPQKPWDWRKERREGIAIETFA